MDRSELAEVFEVFERLRTKASRSTMIRSVHVRTALQEATDLLNEYKAYHDREQVAKRARSSPPAYAHSSYEDQIAWFLPNHVYNTVTIEEEQRAFVQAIELRLRNALHTLQESCVETCNPNAKMSKFTVHKVSSELTHCIAQCATFLAHLDTEIYPYVRSSEVFEDGEEFFMIDEDGTERAVSAAEYYSTATITSTTTTTLTTITRATTPPLPPTM